MLQFFIACRCRDFQLVKDLQLKLRYVINTHVHADHITGKKVTVTVKKVTLYFPASLVCYTTLLFYRHWKAQITSCSILSNHFVRYLQGFRRCCGSINQRRRQAYLRRPLPHRARYTWSHRGKEHLHCVTAVAGAC